VDAGRLKQIDVFSQLSDDDLEKLARRGQEATVDEGSVLLQAGGSSQKLWAIEEGEVKVERDGEQVATLGAGDIVGETGVVQHALRNATVTATSDLTGFVIAHSDVEELSKEDPELKDRLQKLLDERAP
jgi:CRP/FNR family transcriptional regulator, cyclic AMP receptor protein